ncbi:hypothetical protein IW145_000802 [Coemansia sp. RSA 521]|nr:hypothetical protein LPJ58_004534 [Coemansia sp. RSA 1591]KAJ1757287.1 hypothetical protein LPJ69_004473 [Coemansia sp. RSA 1752]KAJ1779619.1 hypothetical protein LPJ54_000785 [Coemansia sp. RSA 1824]KAJ1784250.1 hypothetical protein LPJ67_004411 [Coemansia sp. RSA 1938]KAJ2174519.1 hypothetical protein GGH16_001261 [Coemansia sp. RSA 560]KAJ2200140.1 hypothetical protein IW144_001279 [Coemansia sp. RSA 522]KAJ2208354.1 hypothetical protein IW145_000802 [Coemansia sp. RSA 521]KAJ2281163.1
MDKETQKLLHATALNINVLLNHVHKFEGLDEKTQEFSESKFKETIKSLATAIDKEVTYLIIACKPPARSSDVESLCPKINAGFFSLVQQTERIPKSAGRTYLHAVRKATCQSLIAAIGLINSFIDDNVEMEQSVVSDMMFMPRSGVFWEHCKALSQVPADNRTAVALEWTTSVGNLVKDAVTELSESLDSAKEATTAHGEDEFSEDSMDEFDSDIPADRIDKGRKIEKQLQAAKHTCDKVALRCIRDCEQLDEERVVWLDGLLEQGKLIARSVDDLAATLFMDDESWNKCAELESEKLRHLLADLVTLAITFVDDSHLAWFELCRKQLGETQKVPAEVVR